MDWQERNRTESKITTSCELNEILKESKLYEIYKKFSQVYAAESNTQNATANHHSKANLQRREKRMRFSPLNIIHLPTIALHTANNLQIVAASSLVSLESLLHKA